MNYNWNWHIFFEPNPTGAGNYLDMHLSSRIERTRDFKTWELLATQSELPVRVFYGAVVFHDRIWLMGGYDGKDYHSDVWNSRDGVHWTRVTKQGVFGSVDTPSVHYELKP